MALPPKLLSVLAENFGADLDNFSVNVADVDVYGQITQNREPVYLDDNTPFVQQILRQTPRLQNYASLLLADSPPAIYAPLMHHNQMMGVLSVAGPGLMPADMPAIAAFANHAAIAIENARLVASLWRQTTRLEALFQVSQDIIALRNLDSLLHQIVEHAVNLLNGDWGGIYLYRPEQDVLEWTVRVGNAPAPLGLTLKRGEGLSGKVWELGEPLTVAHYGTWAGTSAKWEDSDASVTAAPIQRDDSFLGIINIRRDSTTQPPFAPDEGILLLQFANLAAIAIENVRLYEQLQAELATRQKAERELAKTEDFNRNLLEASPAAILCLDAAGTVNYANPAAKTALAAAQLVSGPIEGRHIRNVLPLEDPDSMAVIERMLAGQTISGELIHHRAPSGTEIYLEIFGAPLFTRQKTVDGAILMGKVVTRRQQAEKTQAAAYQISEAAHTAANLHDLFQQIYPIITDLLPTDNLYIALYDEEANLLSFPYFVDEHDVLAPRNPGRGITAYVLRTGKPLLATPEIYKSLVDSGEIEQLGEPAVDWLGVPLKIDEKIIGVLAVQTYQQNVRLNQSHMDILLFVSTQVAMAIQRKQAEEEIRQRNQVLAMLNRVIAASAEANNPDYLLETACRELAQAFNVSQSAAGLFNATKTTAKIVAEYIPEWGVPALNQEIPVTGNPSYQHLLSHRTPLVVTNTHTDPKMAKIRPMLEQRHIRSLLLLPLMVNDEVVGSLGLGHHEPRRFTAEEVSMAWSAADQVSGALARARLAQTHQRLITAIEQAAESIIITDTSGTILYVNPACARNSGYAVSELIGQSPHIFKSGRRDLEFYNDLWTTIRAGKTWSGQFINKRKDGSLYIEDATIAPVLDENGNIENFVSVQHDVTREVELEKQVRQSQKMEAVGQLTAGIAHDFNNLLTVINGFVELAQLQVAESDPVYEMLDRVCHSGQRAASLVRQLLAFSRKQVLEPKILDLNDVVTDMHKMLQRIIGENIQMETALCDDVWPVKMDPAQVEQIVVNLVVNARDAMPNGGRLTVETNNTTLDQQYVDRHFEARPGDYVQLSVTDTGTGMSDDVKSRIFEPFFTTKEHGKGTGLGLATVFGIVKHCDGHIWVYSEPGRGTTFKIYLPRVQKPVDPRAAVGDHRLPHGTETILLVENEEYIRELTTNLLLQQGYTVLVATNGDDALQIAAETQLPIQLLLTDVIMPKMGGKELARRLRDQIPELKILYVSGYTDDTVTRHEILGPDAAFIQKPFTLTALAQKVRETLDS